VSLNLSKTFGLIRPMTRSLLLGTSTLTRFAVNGVEAALALDFIASEYRTANTSTTFADAFTGDSPKLTYSTAAGSNSTMTQGYGPELVENGTFDTDTGWTLGAGWTISGGVATKAAGLSSVLEQLDVVPSSGRVSVTFDATRTAGVLYVRAGGNTNQASVSASGSYEFILDAQGVDTKLRFVADGSFAGTIDNISVREAPKLVWAPHNLVNYSEDFSNAAWLKVGTVAIDSTLVTGPDGTPSGRRVLNLNAASGDRLNCAVSVTNSTVTGSFWVKGEGANIGKDVLMYVKRNAGTFAGSAHVIHTLTSEWVRLDATFTQLPDNTGAIVVLGSPSTNSASEVLIYGAHVYRSDLGGMAQVPGADTGFEYYVPTNGNAEYLPRVGHHVYNGSTWVNEGLLIESEPRTNLLTYSDFSSGWTAGSSTSTPLSITGPDGESSATDLVSISGTSYGLNNLSTTVTAATHTASVYFKANGFNYGKLTWSSAANGTEYAVFDLVAGVITGGIYTGASIEAVGNGWYRCSITTPLSATASGGFYVWMSDGTINRSAGVTGDGTSGIYVYGAQLEEGEAIPNTNPVQYKDAPTPSSYMPTSGGTYTRTAQSLTVPPAEFGWPEPEYIGPELADGSQLDKRSGTDGTVSRTDGIISFTPAASGLSTAISEEITGLTVGKVYEFRGRARSLTADSGTLQLRTGSGGGGSALATSSTGLTTSFADFSIIYRATDTYVHLSYLPGARQDIEIVEASHSFREINPLSVSFQMDGRMTYADEDTSMPTQGDGAEVDWVRWKVGNKDFVSIHLVTNGTKTGEVGFTQRETSTGFKISRETTDGTYSPGVLVPFNIASRHGSTFVNGAVNGVALTANTTPTALPDLSSTDLQIAYDFMGTIGTFRQFAGDIGDAGLVTATNPSTEPTLSLTFDGSEGSFYSLNWSE
jgi:hypothetical protein